MATYDWRPKGSLKGPKGDKGDPGELMWLMWLY